MGRAPSIPQCHEMTWCYWRWSMAQLCPLNMVMYHDVPVCYVELAWISRGYCSWLGRWAIPDTLGWFLYWLWRSFSIFCPDRKQHIWRCNHQDWGTSNSNQWCKSMLDCVWNVHAQIAGNPSRMLHDSGDLKQVTPGVKQDELLDEGLSSALRLRLNGAWETHGAPRMTFSNYDASRFNIALVDLEGSKAAQTRLLHDAGRGRSGASRVFSISIGHPLGVPFSG